MSTQASPHQETDCDDDSIYNHILNDVDVIQVNPNRTVITVQPNRTENLGYSSLFSIIPGSGNLPILPLNGIQLLSELEKLQIQQTLDLNEIYSVVSNANKFIVKSDDGETIYEAKEGSSSWQRMLCGSSRRFILRLFDRSQKEALFFIRRLAPTSPLVSFYLQRMDVFIPQCEYIGCVQQKWTPSSITLVIRNYIHENVYEVTGPICSICHINSDLDFQVTGLDRLLSAATISHKWDEGRGENALNISFNISLDDKTKALILACAFLLEYIYFYSERSAGCLFCMK